MQTHVEFRCDLFPPYEGEEDEINPRRYGKRLAEFLQQGLNARGIAAGPPVAQDWGWMVPVENRGFPLWIACGNYDQYPKDGFLCFIEPHKPTVWRWFRKIETSARVAELRDAIDAVLSAEPAIRDKRWWTAEEFNRTDLAPGS